MESTSPRGHARSAQYYSQAQKYLPGGVSSNVRLGRSPLPLFFERAGGSKLYDVDGNEYVDYALGMGPVMLGHADPVVTEAVTASLGRGQLYAGQHEGELLLAREICQTVPCAEMVRFSLSGSEAVQAALRLARAFTGRSKVIKFEGHYHGWFDNVLVSVHPDEKLLHSPFAPESIPGSSGQDPKAYAEICVLPWNDIEIFRQAVERQSSLIAAVIMEPIMCNTSVILPKPGFLEKVRELCRENGIILIFDEVITGFRVSLGGAQQYLGVKPDLAVFGKALGNGYPVSCIAGQRGIMELLISKNVVHAGTFNSNTVSCAAALATLRTLRKDEGKIYSRLRNLGNRLMEGLRATAAETRRPLLIQGLPSVFHTAFTDQKEIADYRSYARCRQGLQGQFIELLLERGVYVTDRATWFLSAAHSEEDIESTLELARSALLSLQL